MDNSEIELTREILNLTIIELTITNGTTTTTTWIVVTFSD